MKKLLYYSYINLTLVKNVPTISYNYLKKMFTELFFPYETLLVFGTNTLSHVFLKQFTAKVRLI